MITKLLLEDLKKEYEENNFFLRSALGPSIYKKKNSHVVEHVGLWVMGYSFFFIFKVDTQVPSPDFFSFRNGGYDHDIIFTIILENKARDDDFHTSLTTIITRNLDDQTAV